MNNGSDDTYYGGYDDPMYLASKEQKQNGTKARENDVGRVNPTFRRGSYDSEDGDTTVRTQRGYDTLNLNTSSGNNDQRVPTLYSDASHDVKNAQTFELGNRNLGYADRDRDKSRTSLSPYAIDTPDQENSAPPLPRKSGTGSNIRSSSAGVATKPPRLRPQSDLSETKRTDIGGSHQVSDTKRPGMGGPTRPVSDNIRPGIRGSPRPVRDNIQPGLGGSPRPVRDDIQQDIGVPRSVSEAKRLTVNKPRDSTYSEYSVISDVMPTSAPADDATNRSQSTASQNRPALTQRKENQIYQASRSPQDVPENLKPSHETKTKDRNADEYCICVFLLFIGLVAIGALVLVFLLMFGVVKIKCGDCDDDVRSASTGASTGSSYINDVTDLTLQLSYVKGNLTLIRGTTNSSVDSLQRQIENQKKLIGELKEELGKNKKLVETLNMSVHNFSHTKGDRGERGYNGTQGPRGSAAIFNSSLCTFFVEENTGRNDVTVPSQTHDGEYITNLSCGFGSSAAHVLEVSMKEVTRTNGDKGYNCICKGEHNKDIACKIFYWHCPIY